MQESKPVLRSIFVPKPSTREDVIVDVVGLGQSTGVLIRAGVANGCVRTLLTHKYAPEIAHPTNSLQQPVGGTTGSVV